METHLPDSYEFPTDIPGEENSSDTLRWAVRVIALAATLLACTNSGAISGWAVSFDPNPGILVLVRAADRWDEATNRLGLHAPHARMHRTWKQIEQARWDSYGPVVEQAATDEPVPETQAKNSN